MVPQNLLLASFAVFLLEEEYMNEYLDMVKVTKLRELEPLARSNLLAIMVFRDKYDLAGQVYLRHLNRVAESFIDEDSKIVALLHDLVEDTSFTFEDLESLAFHSKIICSLRLLTNDLGDYDAYIERLVKSDDLVAKRVKMADLLDNMNLNRFTTLEKKNFERVKNKYMKAYQKILEDLERRICND